MNHKDKNEENYFNCCTQKNIKSIHRNKKSFMSDCRTTFIYEEKNTQENTIVKVRNRQI